jgi:hypothetical protein
MGGEGLGPVKARCPSVGGCQDRKVGGLVSRGWGNGIGSFRTTKYLIKIIIIIKKKTRWETDYRQQTKPPSVLSADCISVMQTA